MENSKKVLCRDLWGDEVEVSAEELMWRPGVYGVLIEGEKILLSKQRDGWDFPGGGIKLGERVHEALVREYKEETGLTVHPKKLVTMEDNFFQPKFDLSQHWQSIQLYYTCEYVSGEISTEGFEKHEKEYMQAAEWVPISEVDSLRFYNLVNSPKIIRLALKQKNR